MVNHSDRIRWSMDLRWQDPRKPMARAGPDTANRMPIMRTEGKEVEQIDWSALDDGVRAE